MDATHEFDIELGGFLMNEIALKSRRCGFNYSITESGLYNFSSNNFEDGSDWIYMGLY